MNERFKYGEASYFAGHLADPAIEYTKFRYELSAFLSASRSLLQFARHQVKQRRGGLEWYDSWVRKEPLIVFFRNQRNDNVHRSPVQVPRVFRKVVSDHITIGEDLRIPLTHVSTEVEYRFDSWPGPESAVELIQQYLVTLDRFLVVGVSEGWLETDAPRTDSIDGTGSGL